MSPSSAVRAAALAVVLGGGAGAGGCSGGGMGGSVGPGGSIVCPQLASWGASPLQASVGGTIDVGAVAADLPMPPAALTFAWTPTADFTAPTAATTQYHCAAPGTHTITIKVTASDDRGASPCMAVASMDVTCAVP